MRSVDLQLVIGNAAFTAQVEIHVVGEVDHRRTVGGRFIVDAQGTVVAPRVAHAAFHCAGKTLVAVRTAQHEFAVLFPPLAFREPVGSAMQRVASFVGGQRVRRAVEFEAAAGDAIRIAANGFPRAAARGHGDFARIAARIRNDNGRDGGSERIEGDAPAVRVYENEISHAGAFDDPHGKR
jgi:hypothetical protein